MVNLHKHNTRNIHVYIVKHIYWYFGAEQQDFLSNGFNTKSYFCAVYGTSSYPLAGQLSSPFARKFLYQTSQWQNNPNSSKSYLPLEHYIQNTVYLGELFCGTLYPVSSVTTLWSQWAEVINVLFK